MTWPTEVEVDPDSLEIQQQSLRPVREHVPMAVREARANRFVSLLVGDTDSDKQPQASSKALHSLLAVQQRRLVGLLLEREDRVFHQWTYSDQPADPVNRPQQG
jgi:hypothetical protein